MSKNKHHFVPRFYLKTFSSSPGHIHLFNLKRRQAIQNASLREQCYRRHFHGKTEVIENALQVLEGACAPVLREIVHSSQLPEKGTNEYDVLLAFVALQTLRTARAVELHSLGIDRMVKQAFKDDSRVRDLDWDSIRIGPKHPALLSLSALGVL